MFLKIYHLFVLLIVLLSIQILSQEKEMDSEQWIKIDKDLMYNIVVAIDINQKITKGLLYGIKGDSIYLTLKNKMISLHLNDLLSLSIENRRTSNLGFVSGAFSGLYLGSIIFLTSKNQSAKYLESEGLLLPVLYETLFAALGGGIGYFIDRRSEDRQKVFYFNQNEEGVDKEIKKLKNFLSNSTGPRKIHLGINLSQVNTRYSEIQDKFGDGYNSNGYYGGSGHDLHSFNLLRKLSLTYEFIENLELGVALCWFGEPDFNLYKYYGSNYRSAKASQTYDGLGYYVTAYYKPLKNILHDNFDIILGAGIGFGNVDFNYRSESITRNYPSDPITEVEQRSIDKIIFSSLVTSEIKYYIYPELSVSLQADYIYLPEKMPAIHEFGFGERNLGNFSFGLGFGINF